MTMGLVIHERPKMIYNAFINYISSEHTLPRFAFNQKYHTIRIEEYSNSHDVKKIIMIPYYGFLKYEDVWLKYNIRLSLTPYVCSQDDHADYYKEIHIETYDVKESFDHSTFLKYVYENYSKYVYRRLKKQIPCYEWNYCWDNIDCIERKSLENIHLPENTVEDVKKAINQFYDNEKKYKCLDVPHTNIFMLHGLPGTGKTSFIQALASEFEHGLALFEFDREMNDKNMKRAFQKVPENTFLIIEDIDCIFESRKSHDECKNNVTFSGLLNVLDGIKNDSNLIIFITTNHIEKLDPALIRRIHHFIKFDYATKEQKESMIYKYFPDSDSDTVNKISKVKCTMNILQKFLIKYLDNETIKDPESFQEFANEYIKSIECETFLYT